MKKKFTLLALLFITLMFSQRPSSTEKWNPTQERYEYFDSNGKITGYKKYNNYTQQWEIIDFQKNPESYIGGNSAYSDGPRKRKVVDLEYPSLSASDIEYAKAIAAAQVRRENAEFARTDAEYDRVFNYNNGLVQKKYDELRSKIETLNLSDDNRGKFITEFNGKYTNTGWQDFSSARVTTALINFLIDSYNELLHKYENIQFIESTSKLAKKIYDYSKANENPSVKQTYKPKVIQSQPQKIAKPIKKGDVKEVFTNSPILEEPDSLSKSVGMAQNNKVTIIEKASNENFYKIKTGEIVGYIWVEWIKK